MRCRRRHRSHVGAGGKGSPAHALCVCDLPAATAIAARKVAAAGLADRVSAQWIHVFADALPKADLITMGMILHNWNVEKKRHLVRAAYDALPAGGAFVVVENIIDEVRRENAFGLLMSLTSPAGARTRASREPRSCGWRGQRAPASRTKRPTGPRPVARLDLA